MEETVKQHHMGPVDEPKRAKRMVPELIKYWKNRLKIEGKVIMLLKKVKVIAPQPLGQ